MPDRILQELGKAIRKARKSKGMSQQELSEKTGISRRHIANIENGVANASFEIISIIVLELNVSLDNIVFQKDLYTQYEVLNTLVVKLIQCSSSQQQIILKTMNCLIDEILNQKNKN